MTSEELVLFIKNTRERKALSMRELAEICKVSPTTICEIENGKTQGTLKTVEKILTGLGFPSPYSVSGANVK